MSPFLAKLLLPRWVAFKGVATRARAGFVGFMTGRWAGTLFAALCVFLLIQMVGQGIDHGRKLKVAVVDAKQAATAKVERKVEQATAKESDRRVEAIAREYRRSEGDARLIANQSRHIAALQKEFQREAALNRGVPCLPPDAVLRLQAAFERGYEAGDGAGGAIGLGSGFAPGALQPALRP